MVGALDATGLGTTHEANATIDVIMRDGTTNSSAALNVDNPLKDGK